MNDHAEAAKPRPQAKPRPMALNSLNTLVLSREILLHTTFAEDQLHIIAKKDSAVMFMAVYIEIFGVDIPSEAYEALYRDAQAKADILHPKLEVAPVIPRGGKACFDSDAQIIRVAESVVLDALGDNDLRGELMVMLVEEYGHYLDHLLRRHYAKTEKADAEGDEGAKFSYRMFTLNPLDQSDQYFADVTVDGVKTALVWDFSEFHDSLKKHVSQSRQDAEDRVGNLEFFKAGRLDPHGQFGHRDVTEQALKREIGLISKENAQKLTDTIYLGNWLRDFSQVVDPMIVRPMADASAQFSNGPEFRPVLLSVEALTTVVEMAATKEFIHKKGTTKKDVENYEGHINKLRTEYVKIDTDLLGVYRPEEHIDNPKGVGQTKTGGDRGDKKLYHKFIGFVPDHHVMHGVNTAYGVKNYIRAGGTAGYPTAYEYIVGMLTRAKKPGGLERPRALVDFGAAMHTLEDYFAHTNFVELSLIKSIEPMVFPWVDEVEVPTGFKYNYKELFRGEGYDDRYILLNGAGRLKRVRTKENKLASYIPVVTGTFGLVDTAASVLPILNEHVFNIEIKPWEKSVQGERSFSDIMIRELLADVDKAQRDASTNTGTNDSSYVDTFELMLTVRDYAAVAKNVLPDWVRASFHWITQHIKQLLNFTQYFLIKSIAMVLNDAQVALDKDLDAMEAGTFHIGIDPSHTQVAKDDPDHPLHELAGLLAVDAVGQVGRGMIRVWKGQGTLEQDVLPVLDKLMRHPAESDWQDDIVVKWSTANRGRVCAACSPSIVVDRVIHSIGEIDETLARIQKYLSDDAATGKVVSFFTSDEEAKKDINALKNRVLKCVNVSRAQLVRAKKVKVAWDAKFAKPAYCKG